MGDRVVIIGAGPTGIGTAWHLEEIGHSDWLLLECEDRAGGLSASFTDEKGFTWDLGGHVLFSHYDYFDRLMDRALGDRWIYHERESWIWIEGRFVPYPFQNNIRYLSPEAQWDCVLGLLKLRKKGPPTGGAVANFRDWLLAVFGEGLARRFMFPYNRKVWAWPLEDMDFRWTGERVAVVDLDRIIENIIEERDDVAWGPNRTFRFPLEGGTGAIWRSLADRLPADRLRFGKRVVGVDPEKRAVRLGDGEEIRYDFLVSTMPLDRLADLIGWAELRSAAGGLCHNSVWVFGVGLEGARPAHLATKCWMYFPEPDYPFYRVTVFSNYSPNNVPDPGRCWSLMAEVAHSPRRPIADPERLPDEVVAGLRKAQLLPEDAKILSLWRRNLPYGYPIPTLGRDESLAVLLPELEKYGIYSRGRFGAWKYEVGNQDHSVMQGVELVGRLFGGGEEVTLNDPAAVNSPRNRSA